MEFGFYWLLDTVTFDATIVFVRRDGSVQTNDGTIHHMDEFRSNQVITKPVQLPSKFRLPTTGNGPSLHALTSENTNTITLAH